MSLQGKLNILLNLAKQGEQCQLKKITIDLARPNLAEKILVGQTPEHALARLSQLMTVCQQAQTGAAKLAMGEQLSDEERLAITYENIEQGFWRLVIDLPNLLDSKLELNLFAQLRKVIRLPEHKQSDEKVKVLAAQVFQQLCHLSPDDFSQLTQSGMQAWLQENNSPMAKCCREISHLLPENNDIETPLLVTLPDEALLRELTSKLQLDETFHQQPQLNGQSYETGALAMSQSQPLFKFLLSKGVMGRILSRLLFIGKNIVNLASGSVTTEFNKKSLAGCFSLAQNEKSNEQEVRLGWVQTARGTLVHLVKITQGKISQYAILAPTEWNFHPDGALSKLLAKASFSSQQSAEKAVMLAVIALDPCIEFNIGSAHA